MWSDDEDSGMPPPPPARDGGEPVFSWETAGSSGGDEEGTFHVQPPPGLAPARGGANVGGSRGADAYSWEAGNAGGSSGGYLASSSDAEDEEDSGEKYRGAKPTAYKPPQSFVPASASGSGASTVRKFAANVRRSLGRRSLSKPASSSTPAPKPSPSVPRSGAKENLSDARLNLRPATRNATAAPSFNKPQPGPPKFVPRPAGPRPLPEQVAKPTLAIKKKWTPRQKFAMTDSGWAKS